MQITSSSHGAFADIISNIKAITSKTGIGAVATTLLLMTAPAVAAPKVVASIQPVHSLAASVMEGVGEPGLIVPGNVSPHSHSLRPSQASQLSGADLIFWVSPQIETFLIKSLETVSGKAVPLSEVSGITNQPLRDLTKLSAKKEKGDDHDHESSHGHDDHDDHDKHDDHAKADSHEHDHDHGHDHAEGANDPHIWLNPKNAIAMVAAMVKELTALDPTNGDTYAKNGAALTDQLTKLDETLSKNFKGNASTPYIVFHDAYAHFEGRYGLEPAGVVTLNPELTPGAASIVRLRKDIVGKKVGCIYLEPQFSPRSVNALVSGTKIQLGKLDPLGAGLEPGPGLYAQLLQNMGNAFLNCTTSDDQSKG
ncbi:MAG: zinc ABC transporter substrate-binding protein [Pseudomonadota bacterium]